MGLNSRKRYMGNGNDSLLQDEHLHKQYRPQSTAMGRTIQTAFSFHNALLASNATHWMDNFKQHHRRAIQENRHPLPLNINNDKDNKCDKIE